MGELSLFLNNMTYLFKISNGKSYLEPAELAHFWLNSRHFNLALAKPLFEFRLL